MRTDLFIFKKARKFGLALAKHFSWVRKLRYTYWNHQKANYAKLSSATKADPHSVIFEAFGGRKYTCSPRAIYEAMCADPRFDKWTFYWSFKGEKNLIRHEMFPELTRAITLKRGSQEYFKAFAESKYWIQNNRVAEYMTPRDDQVYVQCWHGTPFKRLGYDVPETMQGGALNTARELADRFKLDTAKWTYLLSPSAYTSQHLADAFGLDQDRRADVIIEEGYPRNDAIVTALARRDIKHKIEQMKGFIGVPHGKRVLLFAPTWRDDQYTEGVGYTLNSLADFDILYEKLAEKWVVLLRTHYYIANKFDLSPWKDFVINVSNYQEINDLYLISDALCTDYSSVFYDYANTRRPLFFYWPDREHYENDLHGFYIDADTLPGPKCATSDELADALADIDAWDDNYGAEYERFLKTYCPKDDGHASERVIERIFKEALV